jgi:hypothetical protein
MKKIYIPSNLDLPSMIGINIPKNDLDEYYYLVHLIYEQRVLYKNEDEYVNLKLLYLRKIVREYHKGLKSKHIEILMTRNIIECDRHYIKGKKSYGYKLLPPYSEVKHKQIELTNPKMLKNIEKWKESRVPETEVHKHLFEMLQKISINYDLAFNYIEKMKCSIYEYEYAIIAVDKLKNEDFFLIDDEYGRVHTNITMFKSSLRKFLSYQGQKLVNIDIINSQPLLLMLIPYISNTIRCALFGIEITEMDIFKYKSWAEHGMLYDYMMQEAGVSDRQEFKEKFFRNTFFGKYISRQFREMFPSIARLIEEIKKEDYRKLAWMMQRAESNLMINTICRRIMDEYPNCFIATIHDSILTIEENVPKIKKIMLEEFKNVGLLPSMRVELA